MAEKTKKNPLGAGRKLFDGKDEEKVRAKLLAMAKIDASIEECCAEAKISAKAYRRYLDTHPDFAEEMAWLRETPVRDAREAAVKLMTENYNSAMDYLKRKRKDEFGDKSEMDVNIKKHIVSIDE